MRLPTRLALAAALLWASSSATDAAAAGTRTVSGWARRGDFTLSGNLAYDGKRATGAFVLLVYPGTPGGASCHFDRFDTVSFGPSSAVFDGFGECTSMPANGKLTRYAVHSRFTLVDAERDTIDVNMIGKGGVTVPGGTLDSGEITVQ